MRWLEIPKDLLIWNERPTSFGQWLARQAPVNQSVDLAYGVERIERSWRLKVKRSYQSLLIRKGLFQNSRATDRNWLEVQLEILSTKGALDLKKT